MLDKALATVRQRIAGARKNLNENNTKATLIEPVLRALGWDVEDVEEVAREYRVKPRDKPVDYSLLVLREPKLFVEAKGLGENLDDRRWSNQIMGYAAVAGVEWIVLTDGNEWRIYNSHASVPIEQKLLLAVRISDNASTAGDVLGLLAKDQIQTKRIDLIWRAHFVDRQVRAALEHLFGRDELVVLNHIQRLTRELSTEEIRGSMRRCKVTLDFPIVPTEAIGARTRANVKRVTKGTVDGAKRKHTVIDVSLADLLASGLLRAPVALRRQYKKRELKARILRDGSVECVGKSFSSLSLAASAARATITGLRDDGRMRATNGWTFWQCQSAGGDWQPIDGVRQEFIARPARNPGAAATGA